MPAYEVATIKPAEANGYAMPLRVYIQNAFGIPGNSVGWVIGPDWINWMRDWWVGRAYAQCVTRGGQPAAIEKALRDMLAQCSPPGTSPFGNRAPRSPREFL